MTKGDYVLATKYRDGEAWDHWVVGFYDHDLPDGRHMVVDGNGRQMRGNGFRRMAKIKSAEGQHLIENMKTLEIAGTKLWPYLREMRRTPPNPNTTEQKGE